MNQSGESIDRQEFAQEACTRYFSDMNDFLAETVEDLYKIEVRLILQKIEKKPKKFDVDQFVDLLFSGGIIFGLHQNEQGERMRLLYALESEGLVYPKVSERTKDGQWVYGKYFPFVQKMVRRQIEKIKTKIYELKKIEESFTDFRYVCHRSVLCQGCIGYTLSEIIKLEDYNYRCPENENIIQPLSVSTYDEIKKGTMYFKSILMKAQKKWESFLYQEIMNAKK